MFVSRRIQTSVDAEAESSQLALVVHEAGGHKMATIHILCDVVPIVVSCRTEGCVTEHSIYFASLPIVQKH